jgi:hypothetical protein
MSERMYRDLPPGVMPGQSAYSFEQTPIPNLLDGPVMRSFGEFPSSSHGETALLSSQSHFGSNLPSHKMGQDSWSHQSSMGYHQKVGESKSPGFGDFTQQAGLGGFDDFARPMMASLGAVLVEPYLEIHQLDPVPVYYEKYSSFYTPSRPDTLLRDINRLFNDMEGVDHDLKPSKCKIKGFANGVTGRCAFKVQLFWHQGTIILCEFQRRSGCVVSFNKFWKKSLGSLKSHAPTLPETSISYLSDNIDCASLPAAFAETAKTILERDTVDRLVAMAGCDNVDVQREGSAALAAISQSNSQQLSDSLPQIVPLLRKLMLANDEELCRNACVFLANLCVSESCRVEVVKSLLMNMLSLLTEPGHMGRRDSKRHVARALFECSKTPCGVSALSPHVSILQGYRDTQDSALQGSIRGTLAHLKVC